MNVNETQLRAARKHLQVEGILPPKVAVAALFSLGELEPQRVIASASWSERPGHGSVTWHLLALVSNGLLMVRASADGPWEWRNSSGASALNAEVVARRYPPSRVVSVGLGDIRLWEDSFVSETELTAKHSWELRIDGEPTIVVAPGDDHTTADRHREFFEALMAAV